MNLVKAPTSSSQLALMRKGNVNRTITDQAEEIYLHLWDLDWFRVLNLANDNESSVEGSIAIDDVLAAKSIKDYAKSDTSGRYAQIENASVKVIQRAIKTVRRRYGTQRVLTKKPIAAE